MVGTASGLNAGRLAARSAAALLTAVLVATGDAASAEAYVVAGSCRDGAPNGAFELRTAEGQLRVVGAFAKGRRTGTFLFWAASGARTAVVPYEDDARVGTVALWYAPAAPGGEPRRRLESSYAAGVLHGLTRSWHANGNRRAEYRYERGELADAAAWSESDKALPVEEARRLAGRDRATDAEIYASLERIVAEHAPRCD